MTENSIPATSIRLTPVTWLSRLRAVRGYEMTFRIFGVGWFLILALAAARNIFVRGEATGIVDFAPTGWPTLLSSTCLFVFYLTLCWLMLHRPAPITRTVGILPSITAFLGTYLPWSIVLFEPAAVSIRQNIVSALLLLAGVLLMVVVLFHLGRSFSIVPQARRLVRTGPYAVVRHPLYLVEEVALLGTLVQFYSPLMLGFFLAHGTLQVRRIFYEEDVLRRAFPDFEDYASRTPRLIPYVW